MIDPTAPDLFYCPICQTDTAFISYLDKPRTYFAGCLCKDDVHALIQFVGNSKKTVKRKWATFTDLYAPPKDIDLIEVYQDGFIAFLEGEPIESNPYPKINLDNEGTTFSDEMHFQWYRGWNHGEECDK